MKKYIEIMAAMAIAAGAAHAAVINWSAEQLGSTGDLTQISTNGTAVEAWTFGVGAATQVRNGVNFVGAPLDAGFTDRMTTAGQFTWEGSGRALVGFYESGANRNTSYYHQLRNTLIGWSTGQANNTIRLTGLTSGQEYEVQLFIADDRIHSYREVKISGDASAASWTAISAADNSTVLANSWIGSNITGQPTGPGTVVTGVFTADATTQGFYTLLWRDGSSNVSGQINAYQLRAIPEPATIGLLGITMATLMFVRKLAM